MNGQNLNGLPQPISRQDDYAYFICSALAKILADGTVNEETVKRIVEDYHKGNPDFNVISSDEVTELLTDIF